MPENSLKLVNFLRKLGTRLLGQNSANWWHC